MRVIAGVAKGRRLAARVPAGVRPTSDLVREAIFDALRARVDLDGARVADLYCGTGALGIEALSRGASSCTFVDESGACLAAVRANLGHVGLEAADATFVRARLPRWRPDGHHDLVLCDPPYGGLPHLSTLLANLDAACVVFESDERPEEVAGWEATFERQYGGTLVTMLEPDAGGDVT